MVRKQKGDDKGITPEGNNRGWVGRREWVEKNKKKKKKKVGEFGCFGISGNI